MLEGVLVRRARAGHFFGLPVLGVDPTPRMAGWVGGWVGWGDLG